MGGATWERGWDHQNGESSAAIFALASISIDIFFQVVCLMIFVLAGLGVLATRGDSNPLTAPIAMTLAVATPAVAGFFLALNFGAFRPS